MEGGREAGEGREVGEGRGGREAGKDALEHNFEHNS